MGGARDSRLALASTDQEPSLLECQGLASWNSEALRSPPSPTELKDCGLEAVQSLV